MAKSALLALAQSLATELGPQGIRVNSVAPGYIWGGSLKWYFGYLAEQRGVPTAAGLRRDRGHDRPAQAARAGRGRRRGGVPGLADGARHHRPVPRRQLRRVPPLRRRSARGRRRDGGGVGTAADLHASATRITGLDDFGADDYRDGLAVLLESYAARRRPDPAGREGGPGLPARRAGGPAAQRGGVAARTRSTPRSRIERPIFVTGLPRTGTTALHRLLTADPAHQGLELWLTQAPQPAPAARDLGRRPGVPRSIQAAYERHHVEHPGVHGRALHRGRPGGGVLAAAAAVDALGLLRVPGPPAGLLGLAGRAGLDRAPTAGTGATCS